MSWKEKIDQLAALLEKIPQPQSFDLKKGVYQPYFVIELRQANWEILPHADYTRLDGESGKEVKLSLQVVESQKVSITQDELNILAYLYSFTNYDTRRLFSYGQPIGFLLEWLRGSRIRVRRPENREAADAEFYDETGNLSLGIFNEGDTYVLQPAIVLPEQTIVLEGRTEIISANPLFLLYRNVFYEVESTLPSFFWVNFFRLQQSVEIPAVELNDFISGFVPKILPALDWQSLEDHLKTYELPLQATRIYFKERAGQLQIDVQFYYKTMEFPAQPPSLKSLATQEKYLFVVKRDEEKENEIRRLLQNHGLFYIQHRWQIDPQYKILDWLRTQVPPLASRGIEFYGEEKLNRYRLRREVPKLLMKATTGVDWLSLDFRLEIDGEITNIPDLKNQLQQKKRYVKLADGSSIFIPEHLMKRLQQFYEMLGHVSMDGSEKFSLTSFPFVQEIARMADDFQADDEFGAWEQKYRSFQSPERVPVSEGFKGALRDYQQTGLDWLNFLNHFRFGGILADDMGLGKTVQVIALLQKLKEEESLAEPILIVVPLTILFNWAKEVSRFAPELSVMRYQGQKSDREKLAKRFSEFDLILMSYGILLQDQAVLQERRWSYLILDESQKIKNPTTKTYQAALALSSSHRLCLTGTPVENSVMDLWSQFNFLNPGMLGSQSEFENRFVKNGNEESHSRELLRKIIYPFLLRRKKEDVLRELPERMEIAQLVEMTDKQQQIYEQWLSSYRSQIFDQVEKEGISKSRLKILEALTFLRQIACHPAILDDSVDLEESGKFQLLEEMLEDILQEGHKVLIFSQFVRFLALIRKLMDKRDWKYEYMDGSTRKREKHIRNFQEQSEIKAFLISLKAGGLGLNLTAADYVIHLDPWWNPAVEQQATDRAHRIGQENPVFVYKYIMKNSVEEKILHLQEKKKELSDQLIVSEKGIIKKLTAEDLQVIFQPASDE